MSEHIEWSELGDVEPRIEAPGEYCDGYGNQNEDPALALYSAVLEGPIEQWAPWALSLFDAARMYVDTEAPSIRALVTEAKAAIERFDRIEYWGTTNANAVGARVAVIDALRALVAALDTEQED